MMDTLRSAPYIKLRAPDTKLTHPMASSMVTVTYSPSKYSKMTEHPKQVKLPGAGEKHSTRDKGHEEGGSAYAKAGSSFRSPPGNSRAYTPKTRVCLLYCFVLSPLTLLRAVPHHHLALSVKELTYSSN